MMDAGKLYLVWTHYGVQAEAALNVPGRKLIVIDPSSGVRGPLIYSLTDDQKPTMQL